MSDSEDDWENAGSDLELNTDDAAPVVEERERMGGDDDNKDPDDENDWDIRHEAPSHAQAAPSVVDSVELFIVNVTRLTNGKIHSKDDRNSNNDPAGVSKLRKEIEKDYSGFCNNAKYVGEGVVIPCGGSVWKDALKALRDDNVGDFFLPIFKR